VHYTIVGMQLFLFYTSSETRPPEIDDQYISAHKGGLQLHVTLYFCKLNTNSFNFSFLEESQIKWVITVPAIWREDAKKFMREAAYKVTICKLVSTLVIFFCMKLFHLNVFICLHILTYSISQVLL
jgi:hypothetical protein